MKRLIGLAAAVLMVPAMGATLATTASAAGATPTIATPGTYWIVLTATSGCEVEKLLNNHKFIADALGDHGKWTEPTHSTISLKWTGGLSKDTVFEGTFKAGSGIYKGQILFGGTTTPEAARLVPGTVC